MKERLTLLLSWYAFAHAAVAATAVLLIIVLGLEPSGLVNTMLESYTDIFRDLFGRDYDEAVFFLLTPAIWLGLWLTTGKPRFLPWKAVGGEACD